MIFDDLDQPAQDEASPRRRRRSSSASREAKEGRTRRTRSAFDPAASLPSGRDGRSDRSTAAWLAVLGVLILAAGAFAWSLHSDRVSVRILPGEAPSDALTPFIDPILAPLETGESGFSPSTLAELADRFRSDKERANLDDKEIFGTAATIADILREAVEDRSRHIERLLRLGAPVGNAVPSDGSLGAGLSETERRHLETAVGISWHRNSGAYRNRVEELGMRLMQLERGRFRNGAPASPAPNPNS